MRRFEFGSITSWQMCPFLFMGVLCFAFLESGLNLALPVIADEYGKDRAEVQWVTAVFFLGTAATSIPFGRLGDQFGQINTLRVCFGCSFIFNIIILFVRPFYFRVALVFAIGLTNSAFVTSRNVLVRKGPALEMAVKTVAFSQSSGVAANLIVPLVVGLVLQYTNWVVLFGVGAGCSLICLLLLCFYKNPDKIPLKGKFDIFGTITIVLSILALCLMFTFLRYGQIIVSAVLLVVSIVSVVIFVFIEKKHKNPIMPLYLIKNPLGEIIFINFIHYIASTGIAYTFPQYCAIKGISSTVMGIVQTISSLSTFLSSLILPLIQAKIASRFILAVVYQAMMISIVLMAFLCSNKYCYLVLYVVTMTFMNAINQTLYPLMLMSVPPSMSAQVAIIPPTSRTLGQSLSYCLYSFLLQVSIGLFDKVDETLSFLTSMNMCFILVSVLAMIFLVISVYRIGNPAYEKDKAGYKSRFLRELTFPQTNVVEMKATKEVSK